MGVISLQDLQEQFLYVSVLSKTNSSIGLIVRVNMLVRKMLAVKHLHY